MLTAMELAAVLRKLENDWREMRSFGEYSRGKFEAYANAAKLIEDQLCNNDPTIFDRWASGESRDGYSLSPHYTLIIADEEQSVMVSTKIIGDSADHEH